VDYTFPHTRIAHGIRARHLRMDYRIKSGGDEVACHCERNAVERSNPARFSLLDCFVVALLAMTTAGKRR